MAWEGRAVATWSHDREGGCKLPAVGGRVQNIRWQWDSRSRRQTQTKGDKTARASWLKPKSVRLILYQPLERLTDRHARLLPP